MEPSCQDVIINICDPYIVLQGFTNATKPKNSNSNKSKYNIDSNIATNRNKENQEFVNSLLASFVLLFALLSMVSTEAQNGLIFIVFCVLTETIFGATHLFTVYVHHHSSWDASKQSNFISTIPLSMLKATHKEK
eukprot:Awhi_evm1s14431